MKFTVQRETMLKPLQVVSGVVERRQTLPILSNILLNIDENKTLSMIATDLEVELIAKMKLDDAEPGITTLPARKIMDICRALPDEVQVEVAVSGEKAILRSGKSRFTLSTLPANEFPEIKSINNPIKFSISQRILKDIIGKTQFSMAQQDVRYYLNGLLLEIGGNYVRSVATDGHRLSFCEVIADIDTKEVHQVIVPRKGVLELNRLLEDVENSAEVSINTNHIKVQLNNISFTSKLIDGKFPDYDRVIPKNTNKIVFADRENLKQSLVRTSILSNEKYRGIRLQLSENQLQAIANNPELEEAEETIEVEYKGENLEIGFNVNYIIEALSALDSSDVQLEFSNSEGSCLIKPKDVESCKYVIMPMRL